MVQNQQYIKESLQCLADNHILTAKELFQFWFQKLKGIQYINVDQEEIKTNMKFKYNCSKFTGT